MKTFCGLKCSVTPHSSVNTSKGTFLSSLERPALSRVTNDDIKEGMAEQGVRDAHRITIRRDGIVKPTNTFVLTFNSPNIPTVVKICFTGRVKVVLLLWINCVIVSGHRDSHAKLMSIYDDL